MGSHRRTRSTSRLLTFFIAPLVGLSCVTLGTECPSNPNGGMTPGTGLPRTAAWTQRTIDDSAGVRPGAIVVADFDGDALRDFAVAYAGSENAPPRYVIFFQTAPGAFTAVPLLSAAQTTPIGASLAAGDLNGDARMDLIAATEQGILYLPAPADPRDGAAWQGFILSGSNDMAIGPWRDVKVGDIDGVNGQDIVAAGGTIGQVSWFRSPSNTVSDGAGWTRMDVDATTRGGAASIVLSDLNGDGRLDIVSSASGEQTERIAWYANPVNPMTDVWPRFPIGNLTSAGRIVMGDLNADGRSDLVALNPIGRQIGWYMRPLDATQAWSGFQLTQYTAATPTDLAILDVDGNGQLDLLVSTRQPGSARWFTPVGVQTDVWTENNIVDPGSDVSRFATDDLDGDGRGDLIGLLQSTGATGDGVVTFENPE